VIFWGQDSCWTEGINNIRLYLWRQVDRQTLAHLVLYFDDISFGFYKLEPGRDWETISEEKGRPWRQKKPLYVRFRTLAATDGLHRIGIFFNQFVLPYRFLDVMMPLTYISVRLEGDTLCPINVTEVVRPTPHVIPAGPIYRTDFEAGLYYSMMRFVLTGSGLNDTDSIDLIFTRKQSNALTTVQLNQDNNRPFLKIHMHSDDKVSTEFYNRSTGGWESDDFAFTKFSTVSPFRAGLKTHVFIRMESRGANDCVVTVQIDEFRTFVTDVEPYVRLLDMDTRYAKKDRIVSYQIEDARLFYVGETVKDREVG